MVYNIVGTVVVVAVVVVVVVVEKNVCSTEVSTDLLVVFFLYIKIIL